MSGNLRNEALRIFKKLHRTRLRTFQGDEFALDVTRKKINEEYKKNKNLSDEESIIKLIKSAEAIEHAVRTTVIQAVEEEPGKFKLRVTEDTVTISNEVLPGSYILPNSKTMKCDNDTTDKKT